MGKPKKKPATWKGEAVQEAPADDAERAAESAEGNAPVSAERAAEPDPIEDEPVVRIARAPSGEDPDEKIAEAAEAHRERALSDDRPARGKL